MSAKRALISVSDKFEVVPFSAGLLALNWEIISTGGTAFHFQQAGLEVTTVEQITGFPEILSGRVKTIHPAIAGGILARRKVPSDLAEISAKGIQPIDMVVVNLYPFERKMEEAGLSELELLEEIDIGGVTLIREAAKNYPDVIVVTDPSQYSDVIDHLEKGSLDLDFRRQLAREAFRHTAWYDTIISRWFAGKSDKPEFPDRLILPYVKVRDLRYVENPHQHGALYREPGFNLPAAVTAEQVWGKDPSATTIGDLNAGVETVRELRGLKKCASVVIKHNTPCGIAVGDDPYETYVGSIKADPESAFGGVIACNFLIDSRTALEICNPQHKPDGIIVPGFADGEALEIIKTERAKGKTPVFTLQELVPLPLGSMNFKPLVGGIVYQEADLAPIKIEEWTTVTKKQVHEEDWPDIIFGWLSIMHVKSNAITVVADGQTQGIGTAQTSRVRSAKIALEQAEDKGKAEGAILISDALIPFRDTVDLAADYGIATIVQTGGSINDQASIDAANEKGLSMVFTHRRAFWH